MIDVLAFYQLEGHKYDPIREFDDDRTISLDEQRVGWTANESDVLPLSVGKEIDTIDMRVLLMVPPIIVGFNMESKNWGESAIVNFTTAALMTSFSLDSRGSFGGGCVGQESLWLSCIRPHDQSHSPDFGLNHR